MSRTSLGKHAVLCEAFDAAGRSLIAIMSNPLTLYRRADGSLFFMSDGRRVDVAVQDDGSYYAAMRPRPEVHP